MRIQRLNPFSIARPIGRAFSIAAIVAMALAAAAVDADQKVQHFEIPPTPVPKKGVCGDALISGGETCESCPQDCKPRPCEPKGRYKFAIDLQNHPAWEPTAMTIHVSYRTDKLSLPGTGKEKSVTERLSFGPAGGGITAVFDVDHSVRVVRAESEKITNPIVTIEFDGCASAAAPTVDDLDCVVEGCAYIGGTIPEGCFCIPRPVVD